MTTRDYVPEKSHTNLTPGRALQIARELQELSQSELARRSGIAQSAISAFESGSQEMGLKRIKVLAEVLGVHPAVIAFPDYRAPHRKASVSHSRDVALARLGTPSPDEESRRKGPVRGHFPARNKAHEGRHEARKKGKLARLRNTRAMLSTSIAPHIRLMALTSRCFGGMRTSDLHAWDWSHIDLEQRETWRESQRKTPDSEAPTTGPVFPVLKRDRAGEPPSKRSHARELRAALWAAGVHRPLPGFVEALEVLRQAERSLVAAGE